jgi:hypothetical protein
LSFQSLNTILNVAFVRSLKQDIVNDQLRAAYTGNFYSAINAVSALLQFVVVPLCLKYTEPAMIWRLMPLIPLAVCLPQLFQGQLSLTLLAAAFFAAKVMDYGGRSVLYIMAYQPLDFESRYVGKVRDVCLSCIASAFSPIPLRDFDHPRSSDPPTQMADDYSRLRHLNNTTHNRFALALAHNCFSL